MNQTLITHTNMVGQEIARLAKQQESMVHKEVERLSALLYGSDDFTSKILKAQDVSLSKKTFDGMSTQARYRNSHHCESIIAIMGEQWCSMLKLAARNDMPLSAYLQWTLKNGEGAANQYLSMLMRTQTSSTNNGNAYAAFYPLYQQYANAVSLHIHDDLIHQWTTRTEFPTAPMRTLATEDAHIHIQFGTPGSQSVITEHGVINEVSGTHRLESCLVSFHNPKYRTHTDEEIKALGLDASGDIRSFDVMFVGSPTETMMDDATAHITIVYDHNSDTPMETVLNQVINYHMHQKDYPAEMHYQRLKQKDGDTLRKNLHLLAHSLCHINTPSCHKIAIDERTPLLEMWSKSSDKQTRQALAGQIEFADTYILIK